MAKLKTETIEPDPSATSIANDENLNSGDTVSSLGIPKIEDAETADKSVSAVDKVEAVTGVAKAEDIVDGIGKDVSVKTEGHTVSADAGKDDSIPGKAAGEEEPQLSKVTESTSDVDAKKTQSDDRHNASADRGSRSNRGNRGGKNGNHLDRPYVNYADNVKSDFTSQEESSDPVAIRKQVKSPLPNTVPDQTTNQY